MKLSIIIPSCGRTTEVDNLLLSIKEYVAGIVSQLEVLVINQNHNDLLDDIINKYLGHLQITNYKVDFRGLSKAKNYGLAKASGEIVCFIDDDAEFLPGTIDLVLKIFRNSDFDIVSGRCVDRNGKDSVITFDNKESVLDIHSFEGKFVESTTFFKKDIINSYKYDENMGVGAFYGAEEGYDILYQMLKNKVRILYNPNIKLYHPQVIQDYSSPSAIRRSFTYRCGFGYLCKKHGFTSKYWKRVICVAFYIPISIIISPKKTRFYIAELLGLFAGKLL